MGGPFGKQRLGTGPSSARPIWLVFLCFSMVGLGDRAPLRSAYAVLHVGSLPSCLAFAYANGHLEKRTRPCPNSPDNLATGVDRL